LNVGWYVEFKDGSKTVTQTVEDRDEALLVACDLHLRGHQVVSVGPFGPAVRSQHEIKGAALRALLDKLTQK
jgi:hypothetical protein